MESSRYVGCLALTHRGATADPHVCCQTGVHFRPKLRSPTSFGHTFHTNLPLLGETPRLFRSTMERSIHRRCPRNDATQRNISIFGTSTAWGAFATTHTHVAAAAPQAMSCRYTPTVRSNLASHATNTAEHRILRGSFAETFNNLDTGNRPKFWPQIEMNNEQCHCSLFIVAYNFC